MSMRWEYVPAGSPVLLNDEGFLPVEDPEPGNLVLVVCYDERIVFTGSREDFIDLGKRIIAEAQVELSYE